MQILHGNYEYRCHFFDMWSTVNHFSDPDITQVMYKTNNLAAGYAECTWNKSDFNPIWPTALAGGSSTL